VGQWGDYDSSDACVYTFAASLFVFPVENRPLARDNRDKELSLSPSPNDSRELAAGFDWREISVRFARARISGTSRIARHKKAM